MFVGHRKTVVSLLGKPVAQEISRQPLAPFDLKRHPAPDHRHGERGADGNECDDCDHVDEQRASVFALERVEEGFVPAVDAYIDGEISENERQRSQRP